MHFTPACWQRVVAAVGLTVICGVAPAWAQSQPGFSPMVDFNGDARADIADHHLPSGQFWVRLNLGGGTFAAPGLHCCTGTTSTPSGTWKVLVADFNGDGLSDYMDVHPASGQFWYHANLGGGTFAAASTHGSGLQIGPDWEVLAGRVYLNDWYADLLEHNRATGEVRVWWNWSGALVPLWPAAPWHAAVGPDWRLIVGEFTGDGIADVADFHIPSGQFWIHQNLNNGDFHAASYAMATANASYTTIFGDYTGDGLTDYADLNKTTGQFWVHQNFGGGVFNPGLWGTGTFTASAGFSVMGMPVVF